MSVVCDLKHILWVLSLNTDIHSYTAEGYHLENNKYYPECRIVYGLMKNSMLQSEFDNFFFTARF